MNDILKLYKKLEESSQKEIDELTAENERLRTAIQDAIDCYDGDALYRMCSILKKALNKESLDG